MQREKSLKKKKTTEENIQEYGTITKMYYTHKGTIRRRKRKKKINILDNNI